MIDGYRVQVDRSGVGHAWIDTDEDSLPANVRAEIEGEIIDGKQRQCDDYTASNGQHYRWAPDV